MPKDQRCSSGFDVAALSKYPLSLQSCEVGQEAGAENDLLAELSKFGGHQHDETICQHRGEANREGGKDAPDAAPIKAR